MCQYFYFALTYVHKSWRNLRICIRLKGHTRLRGFLFNNILHLSWNFKLLACVCALSVHTTGTLLLRFESPSMPGTPGPNLHSMADVLCLVNRQASSLRMCCQTSVHVTPFTSNSVVCLIYFSFTVKNIQAYQVPQALTCAVGLMSHAFDWLETLGRDAELKQSELGGRVKHTAIAHWCWISVLGNSNHDWGKRSVFLFISLRVFLFRGLEHARPEFPANSQ